MALITCRDVSYAYDGHLAVGGLNFAVNAGDYLCVTGENGSGKSTLIKGLLGLIKPYKGKIITDGYKAAEIGYLPQQTAAQKDFPASAYEVALSGRLGACSGPFYKNSDKKAALDNLSRLGIPPGKCFRELSGGQQRRVLLCRALCAARKMLLLDEPAAGLDHLAREDMYGVIKEINRDMGISIIMVTHDTDATGYSSHILHLGKEQVFFGTRAEYVSSRLGGPHAD